MVIIFQNSLISSKVQVIFDYNEQINMHLILLGMVLNTSLPIIPEIDENFFKNNAFSVIYNMDPFSEGTICFMDREFVYIYKSPHRSMLNGHWTYDKNTQILTLDEQIDHPPLFLNNMLKITITNKELWYKRRQIVGIGQGFSFYSHMVLHSPVRFK